MAWILWRLFGRGWGGGGWGRGARWGWRGPWPGRGPFSHLPPWMRPGWLYGRGACRWWLWGWGGWWRRAALYPPYPYYPPTAYPAPYTPPYPYPPAWWW
ncbi:MAG: hypothetical protein GXO09_01010 [Crenarchaeota archaeon]|nr:hypothetical protein [Thermoproteota archaeon]